MTTLVTLSNERAGEIALLCFKRDLVINCQNKMDLAGRETPPNKLVNPEGYLKKTGKIALELGISTEEYLSFLIKAFKDSGLIAPALAIEKVLT